MNVVGDSSIQQLLEQYVDQQRKFATGLLLGQVSSESKSAALLAAVPSIKLPGVGDTNTLTAGWRDNWLRHAHLLTSHTIAGCSIIGAYIVCAPNDMKNAEAMLGDVIRALPSTATERFMLKCPLSKQLKCDQYTVPDNDMRGARNVNIKFRSLWSELTMFSTDISLDGITLPLSKPVSDGASWAAVAQSVMDEACPSRDGATIALLNGRRADLGSLVEKLGGGAGKAKGKGKKAKNAASDDTAHRVGLLRPVVAFGDMSATSLAAVPAAQGIALAGGALVGRAVCHSKCTVGFAIQLLRNDLAASLAARLQALVQTDEKSVTVGKPVVLPRRVFLKTEVGVPLCDYVTVSQNVEDRMKLVSDRIGSAASLDESDGGGAFVSEEVTDDKIVKSLADIAATANPDAKLRPRKVIPVEDPPMAAEVKAMSQSRASDSDGRAAAVPEMVEAVDDGEWDITVEDSGNAKGSQQKAPAPAHAAASRATPQPAKAAPPRSPAPAADVSSSRGDEKPAESKASSKPVSKPAAQPEPEPEPEDEPDNEPEPEPARPAAAPAKANDQKAAPAAARSQPPAAQRPGKKQGGVGGVVLGVVLAAVTVMFGAAYTMLGGDAM